MFGESCDGTCCVNPIKGTGIVFLHFRGETRKLIIKSQLTIFVGWQTGVKGCILSTADCNMISKNLKIPPMSSAETCWNLSQPLG